MIKIAVEAALKAGKYIHKNVGKIKNVERKDDQETNIVTEVDKRSEEIIINTIRKKYPQHDFLCEESGSAKMSSEFRWIIDPLDGTMNYAHGLPIYSVSIGLEFNNEIILGVVYDPSKEEIFTAQKGKGAWLNKKRIYVSKTNRLIESLLVTGFPYSINKNPEPELTHFRNFIIKAQGVRRLGSAAIDLAYIASGRFDGFWEGALQPWDMAAGVLLVTEAGGKWTDYNGNKTNIYNKQMLTSNGLIHNKMIDVLIKGVSK